MRFIYNKVDGVTRQIPGNNIGHLNHQIIIDYKTTSAPSQCALNGIGIAAQYLKWFSTIAGKSPVHTLVYNFRPSGKGRFRAYNEGMLAWLARQEMYSEANSCLACSGNRKVRAISKRQKLTDITLLEPLKIPLDEALLLESLNDIALAQSKLKRPLCRKHLSSFFGVLADKLTRLTFRAEAEVMRDLLFLAAIVVQNIEKRCPADFN